MRQERDYDFSKEQLSKSEKVRMTKAKRKRWNVLSIYYGKSAVARRREAEALAKTVRDVGGAVPF